MKVIKSNKKISPFAGISFDSGGILVLQNGVTFCAQMYPNARFCKARH
jgi:hypothetical protein